MITCRVLAPRLSFSCCPVREHSLYWKPTRFREKNQISAELFLENIFTERLDFKIAMCISNYAETFTCVRLSAARRKEEIGEGSKRKNNCWVASCLFLRCDTALKYVIKLPTGTLNFKERLGQVTTYLLSRLGTVLSYISNC